MCVDAPLDGRQRWHVARPHHPAHLPIRVPEEGNPYHLRMEIAHEEQDDQADEHDGQQARTKYVASSRLHGCFSFRRHPNGHAAPNITVSIVVPSCGASVVSTAQPAALPSESMTMLLSSRGAGRPFVL